MISNLAGIGLKPVIDSIDNHIYRQSHAYARGGAAPFGVQQKKAALT